MAVLETWRQAGMATGRAFAVEFDEAGNPQALMLRFVPARAGETQAITIDHQPGATTAPAQEKSIMQKIDGSKTYLSLAALALVVFLNGYAGVEIPGVRLEDDWLSIVLGTGALGGFAHKLQKILDALRAR